MNGNRPTTEHTELVANGHSAAMANARMMPGMESEYGDSKEYMSLATYWHTLLKRRWTVITVALVVTTIVAIVSFRMRPIYKATARVQVEAETPLIHTINELYERAQTDDAFLQTQIQVLKSETWPGN